jgi:hypothetical protein
MGEGRIKKFCWSGSEATWQWLCQYDARQVCDLPNNCLFMVGGLRPPDCLGGPFGKSETCRASERRSHSDRSRFQQRLLIRIGLSRIGVTKAIPIAAARKYQ